VTVFADPVATGEPQDHRPVQPPGRLVVDVLHRRGLSQFGGSRSRLEALLLAQGGLLFQQQAELFGVLQLAAFGIGHEVTEPLGPSFKAEFAQPVEYRLMQQWLSPQ
jgi:hypothetical protein